MYRIFFLFVLVNGVLSQALVPGVCSKPPRALALFRHDIEGLMGVFYEYARIPHPQEQGDCTTVVLGMRDESAGTISNAEKLPNGQIRRWNGLIYKTDDFHVLFDYGNVKFSSYVMAMDGRSHLILYSCENIPNSNMKKVVGWVLSRTKRLSDRAANAFRQVLAENPDMGLEANWHHTNQNC
ncbi:uncharacterized protein LOC113229107 [Hyposmocoma kahamanoa]|uniref:uncharacterized protein LOC113229107 n=1 Tax=Hyposmocoma kahamanoa TaxID=1477025 RepID=UPI000E6D99C1|nr:uncharacterized protein LOC113229107 [Hyposmocoma kahamanoa]